MLFVQASANQRSQQFEHSDLNIVAYLIKSLRIKQTLMSDLLERNKRLHTLHGRKKQAGPALLLLTNVDDDAGDEDQETHSRHEALLKLEPVDHHVPIPLLVDYEDLTLFTSKK